MSKIETTSKVSLKLPSRIKLGRHGRQALDFGHSPQASPHNQERAKYPLKCVHETNKNSKFLIRNFKSTLTKHDFSGSICLYLHTIFI